jgi:hypothetical protein
MKYPILLLAFGALLSAETFPVIHRETLWRDGRGTIEITDNGIVYTAREKKDSRRWRWVDIQHFDRVSRKEFVVVTYNSQRRYLGRDKEYRFVITNGELSDALFSKIGARLTRPVTDRVVPAGISAIYSIPVRHEHALGGCDGQLEFSRSTIYYATEHQRDARVWRIDRDIASVWSDDPYRLAIRAYDNNRREFSRTAVYKFDLKEKLDPEFYRQLKLRLYRLGADNVR